MALFMKHRNNLKRGWNNSVLAEYIFDVGNCIILQIVSSSMCKIHEQSVHLDCVTYPISHSVPYISPFDFYPSVSLSELFRGNSFYSTIISSSLIVQYNW